MFVCLIVMLICEVVFLLVLIYCRIFGYLVEVVFMLFDLMFVDSGEVEQFYLSKIKESKCIDDLCVY